MHDLKSPASAIMMTCDARSRGASLSDPKEMREVIFDKYTRLDLADTVRDATGRGLGLAFCRLAVEAHGGRITVGDKAPRGSVFTAWLPEHRVEPPR